ncbi:MAG: hypothetical protein IJF72_03640, partial [Clostridia bacterium]|nr:hypothetical protein [Clostridia bacterium]
MNKKGQYIIEYADLMEEWDWEKNNLLGIFPDKLSYGSATKVHWKCKEAHEWMASANHRTRGRGCPFCAEKQRRITHASTIRERRGSLVANFPDLAKQWHPTKNGNLSPDNITSGSKKKAWWLCDKGHEWQAAIKSRSKGVGCPICSGHQVLVGYNDLATLRPDLAKEWDYDKNTITPQEVTLGCTRKVWWKCDKGHEWQTTIAHRAEGTGCPICSGKKVLVGYNDLATLNPKLASEWHPTKNDRRTPKDFTQNSNKTVWWMCEQGHEWKSSIINRTRGNNCPICSSEFKTSFPEQVIYYYFNQLTEARSRHLFDKRTEVDVYLPKFKIAIEYDGIYYHEREDAQVKEKIKNQKLKKLDVRLIRVKEIDPVPEQMRVDDTIYTALYYSASNLKKMMDELLSYVSMLTGVPLKINVDLDKDRNKIHEIYIHSKKTASIAKLMPELAKEWHPTKNGKLKPEHLTIGSNKKVWWMCEKGHEWQAVVNSRKTGVGCPYCSNKKVLAGENDLATTNPQLASEWHPTKNGNLTPQQVTRGSNKKVWWKCKKGHEWQADVSDRSQGQGCPYCSNKKVLAGENDLATTNPQLASEWHPTKNGNLTPQQVTSGSDKKVWWKCSKGHEWQAIIGDRNKGKGCPYCSGKKVLIGYNDLATINPKLAKEWNYESNGALKPEEFTANSNKKVWWKCDKGHEWQATIASRNAGRGCPYCYKEKRKKKNEKV